MAGIQSPLSLYCCILLLIAIAWSVNGCEQLKTGCKIDGGTCVCGTGCVADFRFNTKEECRRVLKASRRNRDICSRNPCFNSGACSQTTHDPGFRCRCEGTGFYGNRCQHDCTLASSLDDHRFPYECVVI